jgi:gas vesicle protein
MRSPSKKQLCGLFITGAAAGAVVALLFAPKTGAQTRKDIRRFSKRTVNQLDDLQEDVRGRISEGYEQVLEVFDNVKEYVEDGRTKLKKMIQTA